MGDHARIDVHQHLLPRDYVAWLNAHGITAAGGRDLPDWSAESAIALMDDRGIATGVVSVATPGVNLGDDAEAAVWARRVNEFAAGLVSGRPDRFGFFATLTLPDVDGALEAADHALGTLGADGVILEANSHGTYLGDPALDPLMAELDRRSAVVFVHPAELPGPTVPGIPAFAADFLLDTVRAAANLVLHGVPRRFPNVRFILAHAGGFLPYAAHRIGMVVAGLTGCTMAEALDDLSGFYFETALSASPAALPSLLAFARPGHVLFGSDWPFATPDLVASFTGNLDAADSLDPDRRQAVDHGSAMALFPRLKRT